MRVDGIGGMSNDHSISTGGDRVYRNSIVEPLYYIHPLRRITVLRPLTNPHIDPLTNHHIDPYTNPETTLVALTID